MRLKKIDRFFDIGLLLSTILSASELQYASARFSLVEELNAAEKLSEINFIFRIITIPIVILLTMWLIKELFPMKLQPIKRWFKEFSWAFLGEFIILEALLFVILSFYTTTSPLKYWVAIMGLAIFLITIPITLEYNKCDLKHEYERFTDEFKVRVAVEHLIVNSSAILLIIYLVWVMGTNPTPLFIMKTFR